MQQSVSFDVFVFGKNTSRYSDIIDCVMNKIDIFIKIYYVTNLRPRAFTFDQSAIIFGDSLSLKAFKKRSRLKNFHPKHIKFLVLTNSNVLDIIESTYHLVDKKVDVVFEAYIYFLHDVRDSILLYTYDWFTTYKCNAKARVHVNNFNKTSLTWQRNVRNYEKFRDLNACKIVAVQYYAAYLNSLNEVSGSAFDILDIVGEMANFSVYRQLGSEIKERNNSNKHLKMPAHLILHNKRKLQPQIITGVSPLSVASKHATTAFTEQKVTLIITDGEPYTSFQKLYLPFDATTWFLLIATFAAAFLTILIINLTPKTFHAFFYGQGIKMPSLNVIGTFFGIGQVKLPDGNFPRIILMVFIVFCLIIRTAYQGVFFEMITTDMRMPRVENLTEILDRNYTIYGFKQFAFTDIFFNSLAESER